MASPSNGTGKNATVEDLRAIEAVLRKEAVPVGRKDIRKALANGATQSMVDDAIDYMADHHLVFDEGPGGQVLWVGAIGEGHAYLRAE